jgi:hypothetical protein
MKLIKPADKIVWTRHSERKMKYYGLSKSRVKRVMRDPDRKQLGIAPQTVAAMQRAGTKKHPTEIWMMYQKVLSAGRRNIKIISAWRYPGISPKGESPPIPEDTLWELEKLLKE